MLSMSSIAWRPLVALTTSISWFSSTVVSAKMLRASSSTTSTLRPRSTSVEPCSRSIILRLSSGRSAITRCRNSAVSSSSRSGDCTSLSTMLLATVRSRASSSPVSSLPVKTTIGMSRSAGSACSRSSSSKPLMSGSRRSTTQQSKRALAQRVERLGAGADRRRSRCRRGASSSTMLARSRSLSSIDQEPLGVRRRRSVLSRSNALSSSSVVAGLTR